MNTKYISKFNSGGNLSFSVNVLEATGASAPVQRGGTILFDNISYTITRIRHNPWDSSRVDVFVKEVHND